MDIRKGSLSLIRVTVFLLTGLTTPLIFSQKPTANTNSLDQTVSVNMAGAELSAGLQILAEKAKLQLELDKQVQGKVTKNFTDQTIKKILESLSLEHEFAFEVSENQLFVSKNSSSRGGPLEVRRIAITNSNAKKLLDKIPITAEQDEKIVADDATNAIIIYGGTNTYNRIKKFIEALDFAPQQVLIQAQIIETSKNFSQDIGVRWGDSNTGAALSPTGKTTGIISTPLVNSPNILVRHLLGTIDKRNLEAQIAAAESNGDAKVISRPKVVTLNNQAAVITSGIKFHVKTLSGTPSGSGGGSGSGGATVTGGLQEISAGLSLNVTPSILGNNLIQLQVGISNSEPNEGLAVDGIPGIVDNSANSSVIIKDGQTVTLAGLIKNSIGSSSSSVPWFGNLPIIGWLFKSNSKKDRDTELVIFLTPTIVRAEAEPDKPNKAEDTNTEKTSALN